MVRPTPQLLRQLRVFITPLQPPVFSFERSIRSSPLRILVSVLLSARTKDQVTEQAASRLFAAADTAATIAALGAERIATLIFPVGFYRQKARQVVGLCQRVAAAGRVPDTMEALLALPGIGPKSANLVLAQAFAVPTIAVDTHVFRISRRLGWARGTTPAAVEDELKRLFPPAHWSELNQTLVGFGQTVCTPRHPHCRACLLARRCPAAGEFLKKSATK
jgi:endonuclease III